MLLQHAEPTTADASATQSDIPAYAWVVCALTVGLLLSDYMSRQVLNAVFPFIKSAWNLSDTKLGSLSSVVALMVGVLTFPLSVLADRWGRVKSIVLMAALWSLATLGCAISSTYGEMLLARACVGIGEAAYGSVGIALVLSIFPPRLRATLTATFMAGGAFGSVMGMALGGAVANSLGWRWSFGAMACVGIALVVIYRLVVTEKRLALLQPVIAGQKSNLGVRMSFRALMKGLFSTKSVVCAYVGSGMHLLVPAAVWSWMPSFLNRYYGMAPGKAAVHGAVFVLVTGLGMIACGSLSDHLNRKGVQRKWLTAIVYCLLCSVLLGIAFHLPPGGLQLFLIGCGMFFCAGATGPSGAMVANLTPPSIHASAFATLTLANNLLGLAPAAILTGIVADRIGLVGALQLVPLAPLLAAVAFAIGRCSYKRDLDLVNALREKATL
ncbi:Hexuronate transporter [Paraburkholderia domus]|jgi:MFS family permease|uniref:Hexuronate transporter n=1 Tax=Paraburkholderia domus TaxID=2793075 RepID=A0A9N8R0D7_9BURK|nr:MFS transporter [Paraburkholderia domus]MBK5049025.1 MFS transporter [Burkholderia sp. R-70006]MBK5061264.1 MFS transporter [Burkholderia sp. R-70199]MBK5086307.1 MFS transporter [Burkholderia sp. R-69927]MBK5120413.1 MFS transporter [Burkholderia sp. R-69980]MBK5165856.1 MFS transporter [Burkholderia sp. R-70211]MBK5179873.1 MFS transporter [Burkholderia sp. R-69749]MCI0147168.1 MFS transporter [Paraburkholderia sediminicola]